MNYVKTINVVEQVSKTKRFRSEQKIKIFCNNNWKYIREINREYGMRLSNINLEKLIKTTRK